jgi:hypothetical protein
LRATEEELDKIVAATTRAKRALQGADTIGVRVGKVLNRLKGGTYFRVTITARTFVYQRQTQRLADDAALDGVSIIRTSVPRTVLGNAETVAAYKGLSVVERAFRRLKTIDLKIRPIDHHLADRVRAHVFLCMLAYYVEWHMRRRLAPILFDDDDTATAQALRPSPVAPARPSPRAQRKAATKQTTDGLPVHRFQTLLADLATIVKNRVQVQVPGQARPQLLHYTRSQGGVHCVSCQVTLCVRGHAADKTPRMNRTLAGAPMTLATSSHAHTDPLLWALPFSHME